MAKGKKLGKVSSPVKDLDPQKLAEDIRSAKLANLPSAVAFKIQRNLKQVIRDGYGMYRNSVVAVGLGKYPGQLTVNFLGTNKESAEVESTEVNPVPTETLINYSRRYGFPAPSTKVWCRGSISTTSSGSWNIVDVVDGEKKIARIFQFKEKTEDITTEAGMVSRFKWVNLDELQYLKNDDEDYVRKHCSPELEALRNYRKFLQRKAEEEETKKRQEEERKYGTNFVGFNSSCFDVFQAMFSTLQYR